ncbi:hypothetical protein ACWDUG_32385, partial [Streptomyces cellulosae]
MNTVLDWLDSPALERGIHYYRNGDWHFSDYAGIASAARRTAAFLHDNGVTKGVVSLLVEEPESFVPAFLGTMYAGATPSPIASPVAFGGHEAFTEHAAAILGAAAPAAVLTDQPISVWSPGDWWNAT